MNETKTCLSCGKPILGRSDKKFCDDQCRNSYNNQLNSDSTNYVRNINNILRKNRRILEELNIDGKTKLPKTKLLERGFNFNYFTSLLTTKSGKTYHFCYEHGYLPIENDWLILVIRDGERT
ncbi:MAG: hypothetical protein JWO06_168 [Bacteroidota bacterium]|nr:hypothetical protein [Bacteroidota bacterium]